MPAEWVEADSCMETAPALSGYAPLAHLCITRTLRAQPRFSNRHQGRLFGATEAEGVEISVSHADTHLYRAAL